jgi:hypothetical protein
MSQNDQTYNYFVYIKMYVITCTKSQLVHDIYTCKLNILYKPERNIGFHWITSYILYKTIAGVEYYFDVPHRVTEKLI